MKKSESSCTTDKNVYGAVILENSLAVLQNVKYKVTTYVCLGVHPRETKAYVQTCTQNFMVALFMVKKKKMKINQIFVKWYELIREMQYIHKAILLQ